MTKIKLLTNGGYTGFEKVILPVIVAADMRDSLAYVPEYELKRIGCDMTQFQDEEDPFWPFDDDREFEVVE